MLKYFGRLSFGSFTSVSVHVVLSVSWDVIEQPHGEESASLEDSEYDGICDEPAMVGLKAHEDVGIGNAWDGPYVLSRLDGHAFRLGARPAGSRSHANARSTASASWSLGW